MSDGAENSVLRQRPLPEKVFHHATLFDAHVQTFQEMLLEGLSLDKTQLATFLHRYTTVEDYVKKLMASEEWSAIYGEMEEAVHSKLTVIHTLYTKLAFHLDILLSQKSSVPAQRAIDEYIAPFHSALMVLIDELKAAYHAQERLQAAIVMPTQPDFEGGEEGFVFIDWEDIPSAPEGTVMTDGQHDHGASASGVKKNILSWGLRRSRSITSTASSGGLPADTFSEQSARDVGAVDHEVTEDVLRANVILEHYECLSRHEQLYAVACNSLQETQDVVLSCSAHIPYVAPVYCAQSYPVYDDGGGKNENVDHRALPGLHDSRQTQSSLEPTQVCDSRAAKVHIPGRGGEEDHMVGKEFVPLAAAMVYRHAPTTLSAPKLAFPKKGETLAPMPDLDTDDPGGSSESSPASRTEAAAPGPQGHSSTSAPQAEASPDSLHSDSAASFPDIAATLNPSVQEMAADLLAQDPAAAQAATAAGESMLLAIAASTSPLSRSPTSAGRQPYNPRDQLMADIVDALQRQGKGDATLQRIMDEYKETRPVLFRVLRRILYQRRCIIPVLRSLLLELEDPDITASLKGIARLCLRLRCSFDVYEELERKLVDSAPVLDDFKSFLERRLQREIDHNNIAVEFLRAPCDQPLLLLHAVEARYELSTSTHERSKLLGVKAMLSDLMHRGRTLKEQLKIRFDNIPNYSEETRGKFVKMVDVTVPERRPSRIPPPMVLFLFEGAVCLAKAKPTFHPPAVYYKPKEYALLLETRAKKTRSNLKIEVKFRNTWKTLESEQAPIDCLVERLNNLRQAFERTSFLAQGAEVSEGSDPETLGTDRNDEVTMAPAPSGQVQKIIGDGTSSTKSVSKDSGSVQTSPSCEVFLAQVAEEGTDPDAPGTDRNDEVTPAPSGQIKKFIGDGTSSTESVSKNSASVQTSPSYEAQTVGEVRHLPIDIQNATEKFFSAGGDLSRDASRTQVRRMREPPVEELTSGCGNPCVGHHSCTPFQQKHTEHADSLSGQATASESDGSDVAVGTHLCQSSSGVVYPDPWQHSSYKDVYPWLIQAMDPHSVRTHAYARSLITQPIRDDLRAVVSPRTHNESLLARLESGGKRSFVGFVEVLGKMGTVFKETHSRLALLIPRNEASVIDSDKPTDSSTTVQHNEPTAMTGSDLCSIGDESDSSTTVQHNEPTAMTGSELCSIGDETGSRNTWWPCKACWTACALCLPCCRYTQPR